MINQSGRKVKLLWLPKAAIVANSLKSYCT